MPQVTLGGMNYGSDRENKIRQRVLELYKQCPIPEDQVLANLGLYLNSKNLSRILFMDFLYRQQIDVHGVVMDFGTRWGQNMVLFAALRSIYEPYNRHKIIVGFDTFEGFPIVGKEDGSSEMIHLGNVSVTDDYFPYIEELMALQEADNPLGHIKKHDWVVGDACKGIHDYLDAHPHTIVSMAFFDFDIYKPTLDCLNAIKPRLVRGSVLGFDELNDHDSPGETKAVMEAFGLNKLKLRRYQHASRVSYVIMDDVALS